LNNGRMTFRFDVVKDKPAKEEQRLDSGLAADREYEFKEAAPELGEDPYSAYNSIEPQQSYYRPDDYPEQLWEDVPAPLLKEEGEWYPDRRYGYARPPSLYNDNIAPSDTYNGAYHSRRPSYGWKFAASVVAALGIGLLFGYTALSFFRGGDLPVNAVPGSQNIEVAQEQAAGSALDPAGTGTSGLPIAGDASAVPKISVQVAGQAYYLLQYGVFSTPEGAVQAQQELLEAGLAAGLDPADGNRVYAGISPDREQAKLLSNGLEAQGIELYVREVKLAPAEALSFGGTADTVNHYFEVSGRMLGELSSLSASLLSQSTAVETADVSNLHLEWNEAAKALESGLSPEALGIMTELEKFMSQGISAINEYNKNKSDGLLWEVQGSMMNVLAGQEKLLAVLN